METLHKIDIDEIVRLAEIHPLKVRNMYVYGSQVYGYAKPSSDYDIVLVAPGLIGKETKNERYNIHQVMPDKFADDVKSYNVRAMECMFAPEWAKLQEKTKFEIEIIPPKLIGSILSQSHDMWNQAKKKMYEEDIIRGNKGGFHALKSLIFGIDILENGGITDFEVIKSLYEEFNSYYFFTWEKLKNTYLPLKKELETTLKLLSK